VTFEQVRPVLETRCVECHNPDKVKGKLLMHTQAAFLKGGANGPIVEPGQADRSELVKRVFLAKDHEDLMPPKGGPLPAAELALLRGWVAAGAPWTAGVTLVPRGQKSVEDPKAELLRKLTTVEKLEIFPPEVRLETRRDSHRLVVFATFKDATTRDVTAFADVKVADPKVAALAGGGRLACGAPVAAARAMYNKVQDGLQYLKASGTGKIILLYTLSEAIEISNPAHGFRV
jgi:hypothetical protein